MYCGECGHKNEKGSLFCEECGEKLEIEETKEEVVEEEKTDIVFCPSCGTENLSNALFCENCGSKLYEDEEEENSDEAVSDVSSFSSSQEVLSSPLPTTKKSKKNIVVIIVILLVIACCCGIYFGRDYIMDFFSEEELETGWGNTYYLYLKDIKSDESKLKQAGLSSNMEDGKIAFYETDILDDPVMVITYTEGVTEYTNIYYITKDEEENSSVNVIINEDTDMDIELLYEIESEEYNYYVHTTNVSSDSYETLDSVLNTIVNGGIDTSMFEELSADTLEDIFEKDDDKLYFVYMGKETNKTCQEFIPVLQKSVTEYAYDLYYLELGDLTSDDISKVKSLSDEIKDNYEYMPMIYIIKNGEVVYYHQGSMEYDSYVELLEKYEVSESKEKTKTTTASYTFTSDDDETVEVDGEEVTLTGFDKTFVKVDIDTSVDFDINSENSKIKEIISDSSNDFKKKDEIITDKVKEETEKTADDTSEIVKNIGTEIEINDKIKALMDKVNAIYSSDYETYYFTGDKVTVDNMNNQVKLLIGASSYYYDNEDNSTITKENMKKEIQSIFGSSVTYTDESLDVACMAFTYENGVYNSFGGCGGLFMPYHIEAVSKVIDYEDKVEVYFQSMYVSDEFENYDESLIVTLYDADKKTKVGTGDYENVKITNYTSKLNTYMYTFTKEDDNYYFYSVEKVES